MEQLTHLNIVYNATSKIAKSVVRFVYPPICMHCGDLIGDSYEILCHTCFDLLEPASIVKPLTPIYKCASTWEYMGPANTLIKRIYFHKQPYFAEAVAPFLAAQLLILDWPLPDIIVPVPSRFSRYFTRGFHPSFVMAKKMAKILKVPYYSLLRRSFYKSFHCKRRYLLKDKTVLLIDDLLKSGKTLHTAAKTILEGHPKVIYAITASHTADYKTS